LPLLLLPQSVICFVVLALLGLAVVLVIFQPPISVWLAPSGTAPVWGRYVAPISIFVIAIYAATLALAPPRE
jgi:hypothetical protein